VVSVGFPGPVLHGHPVAEPHNLGCGWTGFKFASAFGLPVRVINDAAMQALGSLPGRKDAVPGIGNWTRLGDDRQRHRRTDGARPFALQKGTYEDYVGDRGLDHDGKKRRRKLVKDVIERLVAATEPEDVVIGGGNLVHLKKLPKGCRAGDNAYAFIGGFRMWDSGSGPNNRGREKTKTPVRRISARKPADRDRRTTMVL
jgi:polyphosphate glucokinase